MKMKLTFFLAAFLILTITSQAAIRITFYIDATGIVVESGGMHIAGQFETDGCNEITSDWNPGDPGSLCTYLGNNIYTIQLTFPSTSVGKQVQFLFVRNDNWGDQNGNYAEGLPGETHLDSSCGVSPYPEGWNRILTIPGVDQQFTADWNFCPTLTSCHQPTNLTVTNITATSAQLNWKAPKSSNKYRLQYQAAGNGWTTITIAGGSTASYTLSGLTSQTTYTWKLESVCSFGTSGYTKSNTFKTLSTDKLTDNSTVDLSIYPNPAHGILNIVSNLSNGTITIMDITGRIVYVSTLNTTSSGIDVSQWPRGIYMLKIADGGEQRNEKLIIQ